MNETITIGQALVAEVIMMIPVGIYIINLIRENRLLEETLYVYTNDLENSETKG